MTAYWTATDLFCKQKRKTVEFNVTNIGKNSGYTGHIVELALLQDLATDWMWMLQGWNMSESLDNCA